MDDLFKICVSIENTTYVSQKVKLLDVYASESENYGNQFGVNICSQTKGYNYAELIKFVDGRTLDIKSIKLEKVRGPLLYESGSIQVCLYDENTGKNKEQDLICIPENNVVVADTPKLPDGFLFEPPITISITAKSLFLLTLTCENVEYVHNQGLVIKSKEDITIDSISDKQKEISSIPNVDAWQCAIIEFDLIKNIFNKNFKILADKGQTYPSLMADNGNGNGIVDYAWYPCSHNNFSVAPTFDFLRLIFNNSFKELKEKYLGAAPRINVAPNGRELIMHYYLDDFITCPQMQYKTELINEK